MNNRKPVELCMAQLMRLWMVSRSCRDKANVKKANGITKEIKAMPFFAKAYDAKAGQVDYEDLGLNPMTGAYDPALGKKKGIPDPIIVRLKKSWISWFWGEEMKALDNAMPADLDRIEGFAQILGYANDKAFLDKMAEYEEDEEDGEEDPVEEEKAANAA